MLDSTLTRYYGASDDVMVDINAIDEIDNDNGLLNTDNMYKCVISK